MILFLLLILFLLSVALFSFGLFGLHRHVSKYVSKRQKKWEDHLEKGAPWP